MGLHIFGADAHVSGGWRWVFVSGGRVADGAVLHGFGAGWVFAAADGAVLHGFGVGPGLRQSDGRMDDNPWNRRYVETYL
jgi:hypothetical protein